METKKFFNEIRSIIREEIDYALEKKLGNDAKKSDIETLKHGLKLYKEIYNGKKPLAKENKKIQQKPKFSKTEFSSINDLLNETRRTLQESADMDDEFTFTSDMVGNFSLDKSAAAIPNGFSADQVPTEVMNALTKDYSALMKKIDEKKGR